MVLEHFRGVLCEAHENSLVKPKGLHVKQLQREHENQLIHVM